jgi:hypothetical protein
MRSGTGRATARDDDDGCAVCQQRHQKYDRSHQQPVKIVVRAIAIARVVRDPSENRRLLHGSHTRRRSSRRLAIARVVRDPSENRRLLHGSHTRRRSSRRLGSGNSQNQSADCLLARLLSDNRLVCHIRTDAKCVQIRIGERLERRLFLRSSPNAKQIPVDVQHRYNDKTCDPGPEIHVCWLEDVGFDRAEEHHQNCNSHAQKKHRCLIGESHHGRGRELNATQVRHRRAKNSISISGELKRKLKTTHTPNLLSALIILVLVHVIYQGYTMLLVLVSFTIFVEMRFQEFHLLRTVKIQTDTQTDKELREGLY